MVHKARVSSVVQSSPSLNSRANALSERQTIKRRRTTLVGSRKTKRRLSKWHSTRSLSSPRCETALHWIRNTKKLNVWQAKHVYNSIRDSAIGALLLFQFDDSWLIRLLERLVKMCANTAGRRVTRARIDSARRFLRIFSWIADVSGFSSAPIHHQTRCKLRGKWVFLVF